MMVRRSFTWLSKRLTEVKEVSYVFRNRNTIYFWQLTRKVSSTHGNRPAPGSESRPCDHECHALIDPFQCSNECKYMKHICIHGRMHVSTSRAWLLFMVLGLPDQKRKGNPWMLSDILAGGRWSFHPLSRGHWEAAGCSLYYEAGCYLRQGTLLYTLSVSVHPANWYPVDVVFGFGSHIRRNWCSSTTILFTTVIAFARISWDADSHVF